MIGPWQICSFLLWIFCYLAKHEGYHPDLPPSMRDPSSDGLQSKVERFSCVKISQRRFQSLARELAILAHREDQTEEGCKLGHDRSLACKTLQTLKSDFPQGGKHVRAMPRESLEHPWAKSFGTVHIWLETSNMFPWRCYPKDITNISERHLTNVFKTIVFRAHSTNHNSQRDPPSISLYVAPYEALGWNFQLTAASLKESRMRWTANRPLTRQRSLTACSKSETATEGSALALLEGVPTSSWEAMLKAYTLKEL